MKVNKNIWVGKSKPYNKNSLHFPNGINSDSGGDVPSGGESNIEYLDVSGLGDESYFLSLIQPSVYVKAEISKGQMEGLEVTGVTMSMFAMMTNELRDIKAICIDFTSIVSQKMGDEVQSLTVEDLLVSNGSITQEQLDSIPRITKEQFYSLE